MAEARRHDENNVYYIYDRVQTKKNKEREILREYGYEIRKYENAAAKSMNDRPFGVDFAEVQKRRARPKRSAAGAGRTIRTDGGAYNYRPASVPRGRGQSTAAAAERPTRFKLVIEKIVNMFESIEERGKNDERIAKQRAIMSKKWADSRNNILTALILVAITVAVVFTVYKLCFVVRSIDAFGSDVYSAEQIAEASGVAIGDNLYSFKNSDAAADITFRCPGIKSVEITRVIPVAVSISATDDTAIYYANIWGDTVALSAGLRVIGTVDADSAAADGLIELVLPAVKYSVAGRVLEFSDARDDRVVRGILSEVESFAESNKGMIDRVDVTDEYNITMRANGIYSLRLGGENDLGLKLRMMNKTITSGNLDGGVPASIDLSKVGEASVKYDLK